MEDRESPNLYVELTDDPHHHPLIGRPGVSVWENLAPGRTELPMKVADCTHLVIAETDVSPPGRPGFAFRRYPRKSQGILTGNPTTGLLVVWISPKTPADTQRLRDWGDFVHIRHIAAAAVPGYTTITVYENAEPGDPRFMHFYEMDTDDPEGAYQLMPKMVAERLGGTGTDVYDEWADWRAAGSYLVYCNTFRRMSSSPLKSNS